MNRKTNNTASSVIQTTEGRKNLGNTKWTLPRTFAPLWMTISMALLLTSCEQDELSPAAIELTTPVVQLSGVQASTRAAQSMESVASNADIILYLHDSEAREYNQNRYGHYRLSDNSWTANPSVSVTGGEGHYRAGIYANIYLNAIGEKTEPNYMPAITEAIYAYRGSVNVKADGTFTPDGTLQPYSSAVLLKLKDADGNAIDPDASNAIFLYLIKPVGLALMNDFVQTDANSQYSIYGQFFPNGTADPVPNANTWLAFYLSDVSNGRFTPGTYPATWEERGVLVTTEGTPTAPWPLFEVTYCKDGFTWSNDAFDYVPLSPATTWTVSYPSEQQLTLEAGKLYTFTATLGADACITLDAGAVSISDWSEGDQINIGR